MRKNASQRFDRRRFLVGAAGAAIALPMLEWYEPRVAFAQAPAAPKRLVVLLHSHGRTAGNGRNGQDNWSPLKTTGPLPATGDISPMLAALGPVRNEIVTVDGVDNLVRHMTGDADGHASAELTCLTCRVPKADKTGGGPSIDYVAGQMLRANTSQRGSVLFLASPIPADDEYDGTQFYGANGTEPTRVSSHPGDSLVELFGNAPPTNEPPPAKTLRDRLMGRRTSILDGVAKEFETLSRKVSASDRDRLTQHADFIRNLETRLGGAGGGVVARGCTRPDPTQIPDYDHGDARRGSLDATVTPWTIENLVMALACDVTRVAGLHFELHHDPTFQSEFTGSSPIGGGNNWHQLIHDTPSLSDPQQANLTKGFQFLNKMFALLVRRLGEVVDVDGSRLLDNTLVMWVSDLGYGSGHFDFNNPVILAGLKSAFANGQGRHLVSERRSLGDLYAQVLRMLGGSDATFGQTGKIGDTGVRDLNAWAGFDNGYIKATLPLHLGELDL